MLPTATNATEAVSVNRSKRVMSFYSKRLPNESAPRFHVLASTRAPVGLQSPQYDFP
jgi:hypothetical protein